VEQMDGTAITKPDNAEGDANRLTVIGAVPLLGQNSTLTAHAKKCRFQMEIDHSYNRGDLIPCCAQLSD